MKDTPRELRNRRTALILTAFAAAMFIGIILRRWIAG